MPGVELGSAFIPIRADLDNLKKDLDQAHGTLADTLGKFGPMAATAGLAIAAGIAAAGVAAFKLGEQFDSAFDSIRISTGATGQALDGLKDDFRAVASQVPADFGQVSQVIGELNQRTGLTGDGLQALATQMLNFSRVTGTDVGSNVQLATRLFGDWSIATEDQSGALDRIFRASQATGIGVDALMGKVVQFGAPLRAMGFTLDESAAMLGKWEKEGVNSELVLGSLRIAMGHFADAGVPMREGLDQTIAKITALGPSAEATSLAMQVFGARAGPDMAAAILEGRFALGNLVEQITNGSETVQAAADDTGDAAERWHVAMNRIAIAFEPVADAIFNLVGLVVEKFAPTLEAAATAAAPAIQAFAEWLPGAIDTTFAVLSTIVGFFQTDVIPGLVTVGEGAGTLAETWGTRWEEIRSALAIAWEAVQPILQAVFGELARFWEEISPALQVAWDGMTGVIRDDMEAIWAIVKPAIETLARFWSEHWEDISAVLSVAWDAMSLGIRVSLDVIEGLIVAGLRLMGGDWRGAWDAISEHLGRAWQTIQGTMDHAVGVLMDAMRRAGIGLLNVLMEGLNAKWGEVRANVEAGVARIAALLPHSLADEGPLSEAVNWEDVIVANLPSRLDFARTKVQEAAVSIAASWDTLSEDMGDATADIGDSFDDLADAVDPTVAALAALAAQLQAEIDKANAYAASLNAIPTTITTTVTQNGHPVGGGVSVVGVDNGHGTSQAPPGSGATTITAPPGGTLHAFGGSATAGMSYIVGENRPELFVPDRNGYIVPRVGGGGDGGVGGDSTASGDVFMDGEKVGTVVWRFLKGKRQTGVNLGFA